MLDDWWRKNDRTVYALRPGDRIGGSLDMIDISRVGDETCLNHQCFGICEDNGSSVRPCFQVLAASAVERMSSYIYSTVRIHQHHYFLV